MARNSRPVHSAGRPVYRSNGSAAYDVNYRREEHRARRPAKRPAPQKQPRVRARLTVSPLAVLGMLAAACMLVFVICSYVQLFEQTTEVSQLQTQLEEAQTRNARLQATYDSKIDLNVIEEKARALGMTLPNNKQTVYLNLEGSDKAVILTPQQNDDFHTAWQAIVRCVQTLKEYFS